MVKEASYYRQESKNRTQCLLCPKFCNLATEQKGFCRVRKNEDGKLYTVNYAQISSYGLDPIEKKPLYHFFPGRDIFSLGTFGCNLGCGFCQNWQIAHGDPKTLTMTPKELVASVKKQGGKSNIGIAYTYSEPLMWYEYVFDVAKEAKKHGLKNVLITNGFINEEPLEELLPYIDALNIDVKGFTVDFYQEVCNGDLAPVLRTVEIAAKKSHVELTTLLVPGLNDSEEEIGHLVNWLEKVNKNIPLHLSRYFPNYKLKKEATPIETMKRVWEQAKAKLNYVYLGNVQIDPRYTNTYCPQCGVVLIDREGYNTRVMGIEQGKCKVCDVKIYSLQHNPKEGIC